MMRIGHGYDIHKFKPGNQIKLAGVAIPADFAVDAHSDGDVVCHALVDALLGACALGDIGVFFPDTDPKNFQRASREFVQVALNAVKEKGFAICNIDVTVITQVPKLAPHILTMRQSLAGMLGIEVPQVSIKAKTHEGLDAIGEKKAIAADVVCLLLYEDD